MPAAITKPQGTEGRWEVYLPLPPVPAARPRVSRWGTYYPKTYANWKKQAEQQLAATGVRENVDGPVYVCAHAVVKRPAKPTRDYPYPDVDNFAKAALDAITKSGVLWVDDHQVVVLHTSKRYARPGEEPHTLLQISTVEEDAVDQWATYCCGP